MPRPKNDRVSLLERETKAVRLRKAGMDYDNIAIAIGVGEKSTAYDIVHRALLRSLREDAAELIELETTRLDDLLRAVWADALGGDQKAIATAVRIGESRRRLLGLDHADRINEQRLGLEARQVALNEAQTEMLARVMRAAFADPRLGLDPARRELMPSILADAIDIVEKGAA